MLFRRTNKFGYSRYYGGGGPLWVLRIIVTLAVIFGLVVGGIAWSLQKYMVYTEEGGHLELPWSKKDEEQLPDPEDDIVIDIPDSSETGEGSQAPDQSQPVDDTQTPGQSQSPDASQEGGQSQSPDASQEGGQSQPEPAEPKPSLWQRFTAWLGSLFSSDKPDKPNHTEGDASQGGSTSAEGDSSEGGASQSDAEPDTTPAPAPDPLKGGILVQHVSMGDFGTGHGEGVVKNHKGNGIMLFMKESGGKLNFNSALELAHDFKTYTDSKVTNGMQKSIEKMKQDGYYTVAFVNVFQDGTMDKHADYALLDEDGDAWYDGERNWADPANSTYQDYIVGIVQELAAIGFDEVVLKNASYPADGKLGTINRSQYDASTFTATLNGFYDKLGAAVNGTDTILSAIVSQDVITTGADQTTGQTLDGLKKLGGRLWVDAKAEEAEALNKALTDAGFPENALGMLTNKITADISYCQMNVD